MMPREDKGWKWARINKPTTVRHHQTLGEGWDRCSVRAPEEAAGLPDVRCVKHMLLSHPGVVLCESSSRQLYKFPLPCVQSVPVPQHTHLNAKVKMRNNFPLPKSVICTSSFLRSKQLQVFPSLCTLFISWVFTDVCIYKSTEARRSLLHRPASCLHVVGSARSFL